jgi:hypothetical protein
MSIPIPILLETHMRLRIKIGLGLLFSCGIFIIASASLRVGLIVQVCITTTWRNAPLHFPPLCFMEYRGQVFAYLYLISFPNLPSEPHRQCPSLRLMGSPGNLRCRNGYQSARRLSAFQTMARSRFSILSQAVGTDNGKSSGGQRRQSRGVEPRQSRQTEDPGSQHTLSNNQYNGQQHPGGGYRSLSVTGIQPVTMHAGRRTTVSVKWFLYAHGPRRWARERRTEGYRHWLQRRRFEAGRRVCYGARRPGNANRISSLAQSCLERSRFASSAKPPSAGPTWSGLYFAQDDTIELHSACSSSFTGDRQTIDLRALTDDVEMGPSNEQQVRDDHRLHSGSGSSVPDCARRRSSGFKPENLGSHR